MPNTAVRAVRIGRELDRVVAVEPSALSTSVAPLAPFASWAPLATGREGATPFPLPPQAALRLIRAEIANPRTRERLVASATRILGNSADAEDCVQDALMQASRFADQFAGRSTPFSWLYRVVLNAFRMRRRALKRDRRGGGAVHVSIDDLTRGDVHPPAGAGDDPELAMVGQETLALVLEELSHLPLEDARLFRSHVLGDIPLRDLAAEHQLTRQAVKSRLFRVRRRLASKLTPAPAQATL